MAALPVPDFTRDVGIDYSRDAASANARAKTRTNDAQARDRYAQDDAGATEPSDFDKALRDQDEPARVDRPKDSRPKESRPKESAAPEAAQSEPSDEPAADAAPVRAKSANAQQGAKSRPVADQTSAEDSTAPALLFAHAVEVATTGAVKGKAPAADATGDSPADAQTTDSGAPDAAACSAPAVFKDPAAQAQAQNLLAALAANAPASQEPLGKAAAGPQGAAGPAADPLAAQTDAQAAPATDQAAVPAAKTAAAAAQTPTFDAGVAAAAQAGELKPETAAPRQAAQKADASAQTAATPQTGAAPAAAQPVAALQAALKSAEAPAPKGAKVSETPASDVKAPAAATPSAFAAQLDAQSTPAASHSPVTNAGHGTTNAGAIAHNVVRFFRDSGTGSARFDIRLDPVELGRVDARVEVNQDKTVTLTLSAERPETLAELMRTARDLERQLADSGVKLSDDGLKFRLNSDARGDAQQNMQGDGSQARRSARGPYAAGADTSLQAEAAIPIRTWRASGVDVWA